MENKLEMNTQGEFHITPIESKEGVERAHQSIKALETHISMIRKEIIRYELAEKKKIWDACPHTKTTGWREIGHDSHKRYFEEKCLQCGYILREDEY